MVITLWITTFLILLYLSYPVYLLIFSSDKTDREADAAEISSVSLILLSYNGKKYLKDKINFLIRELSAFQHYEIIVIDDYSTDGSKEVLDNFRNTKGIKIICKNEHRGIPHSMNMGVNYAQYETLIFCDQRQTFSRNIFQHIVEPLIYKDVGAVSGCISSSDDEKRVSVVRRHENFIKTLESKSGNLIGVYGPLYAIKKDCYSLIPENIILDDLYLSLRILRTKKIEMREDCKIYDNNFSLLYDYNRTKRYLKGFLQILKEKTLIGDLSLKQKIMLIWHKYLRLLIPVFLFLSYVSIGFMVTRGIEYVIILSILTIPGVIALFPNVFKINFRMKNVIRMNVLYMIAYLDIFVNYVVHPKQLPSGSVSQNYETKNFQARTKTR